jgi:hypothetical protein
MLSLVNYFTRSGVDLRKAAGFNHEHEVNATDLLLRVDAALQAYEAYSKIKEGSYIIASGYRTAAINSGIKGAAVNSHHMRGQGVDVQDVSRKIGAWLMAKDGQAVLKKVGLWIENTDQNLGKATNGWVHFQSVPQGSYAATGRHWYFP